MPKQVVVPEINTGKFSEAKKRIEMDGTRFLFNKAEPLSSSEY